MGIVYLLTNATMPGLVKIGKTTRGGWEERIAELFSTGVPLPFKCEIAVEVDDETAVEGALHEALDKMRVNPRREFFEANPESLKPLFKQLGCEIHADDGSDGVDPESKEAADKFTERKRASLSQVEFLNRLTDELRENHGIHKLRGGRRKAHWDYRSDFDDIWFNAGFHYEGSRVRVRLSIYRRDVEFNRQLFDKLYERQTDMEKALGEDLEWRRHTSRDESMMTAYAPGSLDDSEDELFAARKWLVATTVKFRDVFTPIIEEHI